MLGSKPHNRPQLMIGYISDKKLKRILVIGGLVINIMLKFRIHQLGIGMAIEPIPIYNSQNLLHLKPKWMAKVVLNEYGASMGKTGKDTIQVWV